MMKNNVFSSGSFVFNSSGSEIKESSWANNQPDNYDGMEHCITVSKDGFWYDDLCYLEKNFVCELCSVKFVTENSLRQHMRKKHQ